MPEAVAAAPVAAPATQAPQQNNQAKPPPVVDEVKADAPKPVDPKVRWKETLKDTPFKVKHKGEERSLADFDPDEVTGLVQRGYGATKLVEEANKTKAEAEKVLAAKRAIEEGDDETALEAILSIGGKRGVALLQKLQAQEAKREDALKGVPPEVRQLLEHNEKLQAQLREVEVSKRQAEHQEAQRQHQTLMAKTQQEAIELTGNVLKALNLPPEATGAFERYTVQAMREAMEVGLELGVDVPPERIAQRAQQLAQQNVFATLDAIPSAHLYDSLGAERVAKLAQEHLSRHRLSKSPQQTQAQTQKQQPKQEANGYRLGDPKYLMR
jgi:hypothetical protein